MLRVSVDALTIRQRAMAAAKRAAIMGWWLLLKEEWVRTAGLVGIPVSICRLGIRVGGIPVGCCCGSGNLARQLFAKP